MIYRECTVMTAAADFTYIINCIDTPKTWLIFCLYFLCSVEASGTHFRNCWSGKNWNIIKKKTFRSNFVCNSSVRSQFCTWHDSWAFVPCAKWWSNIVIFVTYVQYVVFCEIWFMRSETISEISLIPHLSACRLLHNPSHQWWQYNRQWSMRHWLAVLWLADPDKKGGMPHMQCMGLYGRCEFPLFFKGH